MLNSDVRQAYADWISQEPFDIYGTITHDPDPLGRGEFRPAHPDSMLKRTRYILSRWAKLHFGPNAHRKGLTFEGVIAIERQKNGSAHSHFLVRSPLPGLPLQLDSMKFIADQGGFSKIEIPRSQDDVAAYCSKYSIKEGELFFTSNWTPTNAQTSLRP